MISEPRIPAPTATKPCVRCCIEINAASGYCTFCSASQRASRSRRLAAGAGAVFAVVLGVAASLLIGLFGQGARGGDSRLTLARGAGLTTLVPTGWVGGPVAGGPGLARLEYADPQDNRRRLTILADRSAPFSSLLRARRLRAAARSFGGYRESFFGRIFFSAQRPAWLLTYELRGAFHAVYVYSSCAPTVAMTVELRAARHREVQGVLEQIPGSAAPRCLGSPTGATAGHLAADPAPARPPGPQARTRSTAAAVGHLARGRTRLPSRGTQARTRRLATAPRPRRRAPRRRAAAAGPRRGSRGSAAAPR